MQVRGFANYLTLVIISLALHFALLIFLIVLYFLGSSDQWVNWSTGWRIFPENRWLLFAFAPLSLSMAALALYFPRVNPGSDQDRGVGTEANPSGGLFYRFEPLTMAVQGGTIIRMGIAETIAIFGFVLGFLNRAPLVALPFIASSLLVQFAVGPIFGRMLGRSDSLH